ncbi:hypothetical protein [Streptomyces sp. URMC 124]|uniref:hypothetical protein n=1 Tax=Streptomyces sp. URMC 124 TaxID=3423405 RepID=UPI003F1A6CED
MKRFVSLVSVAAVVLAGGVATATATAHSEHHGGPGILPAPRSTPNPTVTGVPAGGFRQVFGDPVEVAPGVNAPAVAICPSGHVPISGGGETSAHHVYLTDSFAQGTQWVTRGTNTSSGGESLRAFVVCAHEG